MLPIRCPTEVENGLPLKRCSKSAIFFKSINNNFERKNNIESIQMLYINTEFEWPIIKEFNL